MNLLGKTVGLFSISALLLVSCGEDVNDIGQNLNPNGNNFGIHYAEIPLSSANVLIDSVNTKNTSGQSARFLVGRHNDPVFGKISASAFTHFLPSAVRSNIPADVIIDSVVLSLKESYFHGRELTDFSQDQVINVHPLTDTIIFDKTYYSFEKMPFQPEPIGSLQFKTNPNVTETIKIRMPVSDLHYHWLQSVREYEGVGDQIEFFGKVNGLALVPGDNSTVILGLNPYDTASNLKVYYHSPADVSKVETLRFNFLSPYTVGQTTYNAIHSFNNIDVDYTGSLFNGISPYEEFDPNVNDPDDQNIYIQSGSGIVPKIKIDNVKDFLNNAGNIMISHIEVQLGVAPESGAETKFKQPPSAISYYFTDNSNKIVIRENHYRIPISSSAALISDFRQETYRGELTDYIDAYLKENFDVDQFLLIPTDVGNSLGQARIPKDNIKLKLYYTKLN